MSFSVAVLGTRGVPAKHGGFETFAEELSQHLVRNGVDVHVYCQADAADAATMRDQWQGVRRTTFSGWLRGAAGTVVFDLRCVLDVIRDRPDVVLTLGYNTAVFCLLLRFLRIPNVINMDGIEWKREKWSGLAKAWFRFNEWIGALVANHLVADHPEIKNHLARHGVADKTAVIAYGAHAVEHYDDERLLTLGVAPNRFCCVIARPEPENSILEIVTAFSASPRNAHLLVLGSYSDDSSYHRSVRAAASSEVLFCGAIYDTETIAAIRKGCIAYVHGHTVGGTNPSLVEALGAGAAVIAHDNKYNRFVAQEAGMYFASVLELEAAFATLIQEPEVVSKLRLASVARHQDCYRWPTILGGYEQLLRGMAKPC